MKASLPTQGSFRGPGDTVFLVWVKMPTSRKGAAVLLAVGFFWTSLLSCSGGNSAAHPRALSTQNYGPVPVSGRAARPTDVSIGGVELTSPARELSLDFVPGAANKGAISYNEGYSGGRDVM